MTKHLAAVQDQEDPQRLSPSHEGQGKVVSIKRGTKQPARKQAPTTETVANAKPLMNSPSTTGDVEARITERAYELYHRRGGHHGQDLDDWLTAEREVLSGEFR